MKKYSIQAVVLAASLLAAALHAVPAAAQSRPPADVYFQKAAFQNGKLSPNGRFVAMGAAPKGGRNQLVVIDLDKNEAKVVAGYSDVDIGYFAWVNDNRLIFNVGEREVGEGDATRGAGLGSIARDGSDFRELFGRMDSPAVLATNTARASEDIFVARYKTNQHYDVESIGLSRLNAASGRSTNFRQPGNCVSWLLDAKDQPRVCYAYDGALGAMYWLDEATDKWQKLAEFDRYGPDTIVPIQLAPDGTLFVIARKDRDNKSALYRYDVATRSLGAEPIVSMTGFDFRGDVLIDSTHVLGYRVTTDAESTIWVDPRMKEIQAKVDALLPATVNRLQIASRPEVPYVLVHAYSDIEPGENLVYNTATGKLMRLAPTLRDVDPRGMARVDLLRFKARDGLEIPVWVTLPKGRDKPLPTIVMAHDGPLARGSSWTWVSAIQFLASRGYAVVVPEYRGSLGFGFKHYEAGLKQWGTGIPADLADTARWAVAQGIADAKRICAVGFSFGGYASLMALAQEPELFRCGVALSPLTDLEMLYGSNTWNNYTLLMKNVVLPRTMGDPEKDAALLQASSAIRQAGKIRQPLLLGHGGADRVVPIVHGLSFESAVKKTNRDVEFIEYKEEGHGLALVKNRVDFWTRVEKFLDRNIGAR